MIVDVWNGITFHHLGQSKVLIFELRFNYQIF